MNKKNKKFFQLIWIIGITGILLYVVIENHLTRRDVLSDPVELIAEITSLKRCSKNGRCIYYMYNYKGIEYIGRSRVDILFSGWCKSRNGCAGLRFKIKVMKSNPEKRIVDWDKVIDQKDFLNLSSNLKSL